MQAHTHTYIHTHACMHTHIYIYIYIYIYACTHTHIYAHMPLMAKYLISEFFKCPAFLFSRFFCAVFAYLVGGFMYMRFILGAKGYEQIPNYGFWQDFGNLLSVSFLGFFVLFCLVLE